MCRHKWRVAVSLTLAWTVSPPLSAGAQRYTWPEPKFPVRLEQSVQVPMRDGVRLSTDLYFPEDGHSRLPVVLIRTPYDKNRYRAEGSAAHHFAGQGYVVAVQDKRGRFESEGEYAVLGGIPLNERLGVTVRERREMNRGNHV